MHKNTSFLTAIILCFFTGCSSVIPEAVLPSTEKRPSGNADSFYSVTVSPPESVFDQTVAEATTYADLSDPSAARMNLIPYQYKDYPTDTVVISVTPTEAQYLAGGFGGYIPKDQEKWKAEMLKALSHLRDNEYEVFPSASMLPLTVSFEKGNDRWFFTLNKDGSLWRRNGELYKENYISSEDAAELVSLMMEVYDFLQIEPIDPSQISGLIRAELTVGGQAYVLEDKTELAVLSEVLRDSVLYPGGSKCSWAYLTLTLENGETLLLAIASDSCSIWYSDGIFYDYRHNPSEIFDMFGIGINARS